MEVYKDLSLDTVKEFKNLLNSQMSKVKIEEGKIINGTVTKISEKSTTLTASKNRKSINLSFKIERYH